MIDGIMHVLGGVLVMFVLMGLAALINGAFQFAVRWYEEIERGGWDE